MTGNHSKFDTEGFERWEYRIGGINTVVYTAGEGVPVMYWHGGGTWHGFAWARAWQDRFKVILPYHPGFGESGDDPLLTSMDDYVQHYVELFDALGLKSAALVGASMGGYMATSFAIAYPRRVSKLALVSPAGISSPEFPMGNRRDMAPDDLPGMFIVNRDLIKPFWPDRWNERAAREEQSAGKTFGPSSTFGPKLLRRIGRVTMPTLVIWGKEDRLLPVGLAALWGKAIPHATMRIVEGAGHLLLDESAAARDAVKSFLG
jgi:pimeloyl-ACP methyl ester carboxylesterase